jgi:hypothetical protein
VHPLLLSLFVVLKKSRTSPEIGSVSEDDPGITDDTHYTSPSDLPSLNIHVPGKNGVSPASFAHSDQLRSAASCPECMASEPQDNSGTNDIATDMPPVVYGQEDIPSKLADDSAEVSSNSKDNAPRKGKGYRHVSSTTVRSKCQFFIVVSQKLNRLTPMK